MDKAIIGRKVGMSQIFDEAGKVIPVTVIEAGPCVVIQKKTPEIDGYEAVQLGFGLVEARKLSKPEQGHLKKAGSETYKHLKEFKLSGVSAMSVGDRITADVFKTGERVDVIGTSKGKGYQGVVKRHGAHMGAKSHGGGPVHRHQGSMGANTDPSRVFPGKIMPGHMGSEQVTILNLEVVRVNAELNLIALRGAVPGPRGSLVTLRDTVINA